MLRSTLLRRALAVCLATFAGLVVPAPVGAHSDIDFLLPAEDASLGEPLTEITVAFTQTVTLIGPGFEVLSPQGELYVPFVVTDDDQVFRLQIDPPMGGGDVGVRWEVTAQDGHVISGGYSFTVSVDAPVPTTAPPVAAAPTTAAPATTTPPVATTEPVATTMAPMADAAMVADDDGSTGLYIAIAVAVALGAAAFLGFRRRPVS